MKDKFIELNKDWSEIMDSNLYFNDGNILSISNIGIEKSINLNYHLYKLIYNYYKYNLNNIL